MTYMYLPELAKKRPKMFSPPMINMNDDKHAYYQNDMRDKNYKKIINNTRSLFSTNVSVPI